MLAIDRFSALRLRALEPLLRLHTSLLAVTAQCSHHQRPKRCHFTHHRRYDLFLMLGCLDVEQQKGKNREKRKERCGRQLCWSPMDDKVRDTARYEHRSDDVIVLSTEQRSQRTLFSQYSASIEITVQQCATRQIANCTMLQFASSSLLERWQFLGDVTQLPTKHFA